MKKLKEKVAETEKKPVDRVLRNMELNLKDIGKEKEKYDPYSSRPSRDESGRDRDSRDRDYDRNRRNERDSGDRDRNYDRDTNRNERGSRDRDGRDRDYDRDTNRGERRRERRDETPRDRRDEYDSRGRETGYNSDRDRVEGFGAELLSNFRRVINGGR